MIARVAEVASEQPTWLEWSLRGEAPPRPGNAVAALLVLDDGRYLMQLRDAIPNIFYPCHWGCFGGAVNEGESPRAAIEREVQEELEYSLVDPTELTRFDFDFSKFGYPPVYRIYFVARIRESALQKITLHEGAAVEALSGEDLLVSRRVTPYDAFAIWMHMSAQHFKLA